MLLYFLSQYSLCRMFLKDHLLWTVLLMIVNLIDSQETPAVSHITSLPARASEQGNWRASETLFSHVYGNSRYVRLFLIRMRALVFCELITRASWKRKTF